METMLKNIPKSFFLDPSTGRHLTYSSTLEGDEGRLPKAGRSKHRREREGEGILCTEQGVGGRGLRVTAACWWRRRDTPRRLMFDGTTAHKSPCPTQVNQDNMTWGRVSFHLTICAKSPQYMITLSAPNMLIKQKRTRN